MTAAGFKVYLNEPHDSTSISNNWIWEIYEDPKRVSTWEGLNRYDRDTDTFICNFAEDTRDFRS